MIVGILGNEHSGKSTIAKHLADKHGFHRMHSMAPVNELLRSLFGFTNEQLSGTSSARNEPHRSIPGLTARKAQKVLGMAIRSIHEDALIDALFSQAEWLMVGRSQTPSVGPDVSRIAVENVRFAGEVAAIKRRGGRIIRLRGGTVSDHPTETEQLSIPDSECDAVLPWHEDKRKRFELVDALIYCWSDL